MALDKVLHPDVSANPNCPCYAVLPSKSSCKTDPTISAGDTLAGPDTAMLSSRQLKCFPPQENSN